MNINTHNKEYKLEVYNTKIIKRRKGRYEI